MKIYGAELVHWTDILAEVLGRNYGISPLPVLEKNEYGKPFFPALPEVRFSVSHAKTITLVAVSAKPVGVDVEDIRPRKADLPRYALTDPEYADYLALGGDWPAFYALWTRREAWCKYVGLGLARLWGQTPPVEGLCFGCYQGEGWRAAVCGEEEPPKEIIWMEGAHHEADNLIL